MKIVNVTLFDGASEELRPGRTVEVDGDRIRWIGSANDSPAPRPGERVVDGTGLTLVPGLIDCHVHLAHDGEANWMGRPPRTPAEETLGVVRNAATALAAGITTVRDVGSGPARAPLALSLTNDVPGVVLPRVISAGSPITMTGGHLHWEAVEADGIDGVRRAVRAELKRGVQWIKIMATGGVLTPGTDVGSESFTRDEIVVAVQEARRAGRRVSAHAIGNAGIKNALVAGVSTIEHGSYLDREAIELMLEREAVHVPTLSAYDRVVTKGVAAGIPAESVAKALSAHESNLDSFRSSLAAGVTIAAGTDAGTPDNPHGMLAYELELMVGAGATPFQALQTATVNAAAALNLEEDIGQIAVSKVADLILVEGNPLEQLACLARPVMVMRGGQIAYAAVGLVSTEAPVALGARS